MKITKYKTITKTQNKDNLLNFHTSHDESFHCVIPDTDARIDVSKFVELFVDTAFEISSYSIYQSPKPQ